MKLFNQSKQKAAAFSHINRRGQDDDYFGGEVKIKISLLDRIGDKIESYQSGQAKFIDYVIRYRRHITVIGVMALLGLAMMAGIPIVRMAVDVNTAQTELDNLDYHRAFIIAQNHIKQGDANLPMQLIAIRAGIMIGEYTESKRLIGKIYTQDNIDKDPSIHFYYALTQIHEPAVTDRTLRALLDEMPEHSAGRALRGYLSRGDSALYRRSREDFIRSIDSLAVADEIGFLDLQLMHRMLIAENQVAIDVLDNLPWSGKSRFSIAPLLGFDPEDFIFKLQVKPSTDSKTFVEGLLKLSDETIVNFYYAVMLIEQREFIDAIAIIDEIKSFVGDDNIAVLQLEGILQFAQRQWQDVIESFNRVEQLAAADSEQGVSGAQAKLNLAAALIYSPQTDWEAVDQLYEEVLALDPHNHQALANKAYSLILSGNYVQADAMLLALNNRNFRLALLAGISYLYQNDYSLASQMFSEISHTDLPEAYLLEGAALQLQGKYKEAFQYYLAILETSPQVHFRHIVLLFQLKMLINLGLVDAVEHFISEHPVEDFPDQWQYHYLLGIAALMAGNEAEATQHLNTLRAGTDYYYNALQAQIDDSSGRRDNALQSYYLVIDDPDAPALFKQEMAVAAARLLQQIGAANRAVNLLRSNQFTAYPPLESLLAVLLVNSDPLRAQSLIEKSLKWSDSPQVKKDAGAVYRGLKDIAKATKLYEQARQQNPLDEEAVQALLSIAEQVDNTNEVAVLKRTLDAIKQYQQGQWIEENYQKLEVELYVPKSLPGRRTNQLLQTIAKVSQGADPKSAYDLYAELLKIAPDRIPEIAYSRATFALLLEESDNAIRDLEFALSKKDIKAELETLAGELYIRLLMRRDDNAQALEALGRLYRKDRLSLDFYSTLSARALIRSNYRDKAIVLLADYLKRVPNNLAAHTNLASLYVESGREKQAEKQALLMARLFAGYPEVYNILVAVYDSNPDVQLNEFYRNVYIGLIAKVQNDRTTEK